MNSSGAICNIGCGLNLNNSTPVTCVNDLIKEFNAQNNTTLPELKHEVLLALIFNEFERLYNIVQAGDLEYFYELYYSLWLHR